MNAPICRQTHWSRDNHLGNTKGGFTPFFNWILPDKPSDKCVLRIRYNVSTNDYDRWNTFQNDNNKQTSFNFYNKLNLSYLLKTINN